MLRSSIDLGTNTCLLLLADWEPVTNEAQRVLLDVSTVVRLGQGVDQERKLAAEAMDRTLRCLKEYSEKIKGVGLDPSETVCIATSQARDAKNGQEFFSRVEKETGFKFRIISGSEEAEMTFVGALLPGMKPEKCAVIDIGGGSTEIISNKGGQSVDTGAVRFTERYLKVANDEVVSDAQFWACQSAIDSSLKALLEWRKQNSSDTELVAVAGTATSLAAWFLDLEAWDASKVDQVTLSRGDVHRMVEDLKWRTSQERAKLPCMEPGRADVILAGAMILWRAMELLDFKNCRVSSRGIRFGALKTGVALGR